MSDMRLRGKAGNRVFASSPEWEVGVFSSLVEGVRIQVDPGKVLQSYHIYSGSARRLGFG